MQQQPLNATLAFKAGNSDKVYKLALLQTGEPGVLSPPRGWEVRFLYGRRGANLKGGAKTSAPVSYSAARAVFFAVLREKISGGYWVEAATAGDTELDGIRRSATPPSAAGSTLRDVAQNRKRVKAAKPSWMCEFGDCRQGKKSMGMCLAHLVLISDAKKAAALAPPALWPTPRFTGQPTRAARPAPPPPPPAPRSPSPFGGGGRKIRLDEDED
jgi:hypothetical protein